MGNQSSSLTLGRQWLIKVCVQCLQKVPTMGYVISKRTARIYDSGNESFSCTTGDAVGTAVAHVLLKPDGTVNRYLKTASFKTTQNQILSAFEEINAKEVTRVTTKQVLEERGELIKQQRFPEVFMGIIAIQLFEDGAGRGVTAEVGDSDNELLGVKEEDIRDVLRRFV